MRTIIVEHSADAGAFYGQLERNGVILESFCFTNESSDIDILQVVCDWCVDHGLSRQQRDEALEVITKMRNSVRAFCDHVLPILSRTNKRAE